MAVRQITEEEKKQVIQNQKDSNGILHCFISGEVINPDKDEIEFYLKNRNNQFEYINIEITEEAVHGAGA